MRIIHFEKGQRCKQCSIVTRNKLIKNWFVSFDSERSEMQRKGHSCMVFIHQKKGSGSFMNTGQSIKPVFQFTSKLQ